MVGRCREPRTLMGDVILPGVEKIVIGQRRGIGDLRLRDHHHLGWCGDHDGRRWCPNVNTNVDLRRAQGGDEPQRPCCQQAKTEYASTHLLPPWSDWGTLMRRVRWIGSHAFSLLVRSIP